MPALFGGQMGYNDPPVMAHLMLIKGRPLLCNDEVENSKNNNAGATIQKITGPNDGLPVALLVERGQCTFYEKASIASQWGDAVKYVVVYDNEQSPDLVPMSSEYPSNMTLLFVSNLSGQGK
jgi:hypothetical protein